MFSENDAKLEEHNTFHRNNQLLRREFYLNGKLEGESKSWRENGQLSEHQFYLNGKLEGERKYWHVNGHICMKIFYRNGKLDGECRSWYENGSFCARGFHRNGESIGWPFTSSKKRGLLRMKKCLRNCVDLFDSFTISDLARIICS